MSLRLLCLLLVLVVPRVVSADEAALPGYDNYAALSERIKKLDESSDLGKAESLGKTLGGRELWLITLSTGDASKKPALLVVGSIHAPHVVGSQLSVQMAESMVAQKDNEDVKKLLERFTLYIVPRPNPDASEAVFRKPFVERSGNDRPTDDDRDSDTNEDPTDDLNGDGWITLMRVEDDGGNLMPHPTDARVLIEIDPRKNERGKYKLYTEGRDDDHDELFNEDGAGGVSTNRNFAFRYPFFQPGAGPHQISEVETRALADFAFSHPNVALVFIFTPEDNLFEPWKANSSTENERIKTNVLSSDAEHLNYVAEQYRKLHGGKDAPLPSKGEGSFSEWAYFHYGRWSLGARGWWIPKTEAKSEAKVEGQPTDAKTEEQKQPDADKKPDDAADKAKDDKPDHKKEAASKPSDEKRGAEDLNGLRWMKENNIDGFVDWTPIEHPDFPGKKVEIGGFKPYLRLNPPAAELPKLAEVHTKFLLQLGELMPRLEIKEAKVEAIGSDVYRLTVTVANRGYLPTMSAMGNVSEKPYPVQISLELANGMKLVTGFPRVQLPPIAGGGASSEQVWLIQVADPQSRQLKVSAASPSVGEDSKTVELK